MPPKSKGLASKWATETSARRSNVCRLCMDPEAAEAVAEILRLRHEGKSQVSVRQVCAWLRDVLKRPHSETTVLGHCSKHLGAPWGIVGANVLAAKETVRAAKRR